MLHVRCFILCSALAGSANAGSAFSLSSPDIAPQSRIGETFVYDGGSCRGGNRSPALQWSSAPAGTKSFAVTVFDPDAPTGHGWWHWLLLNLPGDVSALPAGAGDSSGASLPAGSLQLRNDFGETGYGGPCPPPGPPHRYVFTVHALDVTALPLSAKASAAQADAALRHHALATAAFTALYSR